MEGKSLVISNLKQSIITTRCFIKLCGNHEAKIVSTATQMGKKKPWHRIMENDQATRVDRKMKGIEIYWGKEVGRKENWQKSCQ